MRVVQFGIRSQTFFLKLGDIFVRNSPFETIFYFCTVLFNRFLNVETVDFSFFAETISHMYMSKCKPTIVMPVFIIKHFHFSSLLKMDACAQLAPSHSSSIARRCRRRSSANRCWPLSATWRPASTCAARAWLSSATAARRSSSSTSAKRSHRKRCRPPFAARPTGRAEDAPSPLRCCCVGWSCLVCAVTAATWSSSWPADAQRAASPPGRSGEPSGSRGRKSWPSVSPRGWAVSGADLVYWFSSLIR